MQFTAPAEHYDRFMGRYVPQLAVALADAAGVAAGHARARRRLRPGRADARARPRASAPTTSPRSTRAEQFADACRERNPGADVRVGVAEELPFEDGAFDAALCSLVVAFMRDAAAGRARDGARHAPGRRRSPRACGTSRAAG